MRLRAALGLIEKLTKSPEEVSSSDIDELTKVGLADDAIRDVIYVCALMNVMDRLEHAFGFSTEGIRMSAGSLRRVGYRMLP